MSTPQLYFSAEEEIHKAVKIAAEEDGRTRSDWIRLQIIATLERRGLLDKKTRKPGRGRNRVTELQPE